MASTHNLWWTELLYFMISNFYCLNTLCYSFVPIFKNFIKHRHNLYRLKKVWISSVNTLETAVFLWNLQMQIEDLRYLKICSKSRIFFVKEICFCRYKINLTFSCNFAPGYHYRVVANWIHIWVVLWLTYVS